MGRQLGSCETSRWDTPTGTHLLAVTSVSRIHGVYSQQQLPAVPTALLLTGCKCPSALLPRSPAHTLA
jgi:hypothetical protein